MAGVAFSHKIAYPSKKAAKTALKIVHKQKNGACRKCRSGWEPNVYRCGVCDGYHWGHTLQVGA